MRKKISHYPSPVETAHNAGEKCARVPLHERVGKSKSENENKRLPSNFHDQLLN